MTLDSSVQDRTQQKDEALQRSLKELADIKFALDEAAIVAITDQRGVINYVNDKFCEISKYTRAELIGQDHRIINSAYHPKDFIRDLWTTIASGKVWHGEIKNRAKDGSYYWVDTTIVPFLNAEGKPYQYVAIRNDITERKSGEERIRQQAALLDQAQDAILVRDLDHTIRFWNKGAERIYGWLAEEAIGRNANELLSNTPVSRFEEATKAVIERGEWHGEFTQLRSDGAEIIVEGRWTLVNDDLGVPRSILVINTDVTERHRAAYRRPYISDDHAACRGWQDDRRDLCRTKDDIQDDCDARRHAPQCTSYSVRPLYPRDSGENDDFHAPTHVRRPSL